MKTMKSLTLIFFAFFFALTASAQIDYYPVDAGQYVIYNVGAGDTLTVDRQYTSPAVIAYRNRVDVVDTILKIPATAPDDTISTLLTVATTIPDSLKVALLFERGSHRQISFSISRDNMIVGPYGSGPKAVLSGFTTVTDWTDYGDGIYYKVINPESAPNMLTIDGVQYGMGRTPNDSTYVYEEAISNTAIIDNQLTGTPDWTGAEIAIWKNTVNKIDRATITSQNGDTLNYTSLGSTYSGTDNSYYFIQNDIRTLDQFGEWYYKSTNDTLFVYFGATDPATVTTKVSVIDNLMKNSGGYDYITVRDLKFEGSNSSAIRFTGGTDYCDFIGNEVVFSGGDGFTLSGANNSVTNSSFRNLNGGNNYGYNAGGGILMLGNNATISNCTFDDIGLIPGQAFNSAFLMGATFNGDTISFSNNTLDSIGYMGVYMRDQSQYGTIQNNYFNETCMLLEDAGSIYINYDKTGTLVDGNIVLYSGGDGIYLDETARGATVSNNTVVHSYGNGIKGHKTSNDTIINNTLYNNGVGIDYTNWTTTQYFQGMVADSNIVVADSLQYLWNFTNRNTSTDSIGSATGNYYVTGALDSTRFVTNVVGSNTIRLLSGWKTLTNTDAGSFLSGKIYGDNVEFYYNATASATNVSLTDTLTDAAGTEYTGTLTLQPFVSKVLFRSYTLPEPDYMYGDLVQESFEGTGYENSWTEVVGTNTGVVVDEDNADTTITGGGSQVLKIVNATSPTATATASRAYTYTSFTDQQIAYADSWVNIDSHGINSGSSADLMTLMDGSGVEAISVRAYNESGTLKFITFYYSNGTSSNTISSVEITEGEWYHVKLKYDITNMQYSAYVGENEIASGSLTGTVKSEIGRIRFGRNATVTVTTYHDLINVDSEHFSNY